MPHAKCWCGKYCYTVGGFKAHHREKHGGQPDGKAIEAAITRAQGDTR